MRRTYNPARNGHSRPTTVDELSSSDNEAWEAFDAEREAAHRADTERESAKRGCDCSVSDSNSNSVSVSVSADEFFESVLVVVNATPAPSIDVSLPVEYSRLVHVCFVLQGLAGDEDFYLDARRAARLIGASAMTAWRRLDVLCQCGVLRRGERGNQRRSNRYRFVARSGNGFTRAL